MSFPRYPAYKESGFGWVGRIPAQWDCLAGRRVFRQVRELPIDGDVQLSATQKYGVVPQTLFMEMEDQKVALALGGVGNFKRVKENDFVISLRSFQGGIEHSKYNGCVSPAYTVLRLTMPCQPAYLAYLLKSPGYVIALQSVTDGIRDGKNISYEQFGVIGLPIPLLDEQQAIATFLNHETAKIDALVAEQERLIELLKEKRQAVISHAVTKGLDPSVPMKDSGVEWLGDVPAHWSVSPLKHLVDESVAGPYGASLTKAMYSESGYRVYGQQQVIADDFSIGDYFISEEKYAEMRRYTVYEGDVLVSVMGTIGKVAVVTAEAEPGIINPRLVRYRCNGLVQPRFLQRVLMCEKHQEHLSLESNGTTMEGLNMVTLGKVPVPTPPLNEQQQILSYLSERDSEFHPLIDEAAKTIELLQERRTALISAAVTGQIDVRGCVPQEASA